MMRVLGPGEEKRRAEAEKRDVAPEVQDRLDNRVRFKKAFGYSKEDEELIFKPMMDTAHEPMGSMGDDTPVAAFSAHPQLMYRYFKQRFAEVTNPPIDPLLERRVMSLGITFGRKGRILEESQHAAFLVRLPSPVVTEQQMNWITSHPEFRSHVLDATFDPADGDEGLQKAVERLQQEALSTIKSSDVSYLVLSDRAVGPSKAPIPMLMAVGAVHHGLIKAKSRMAASILVESAEPREDHHIACLISFGASLVHPYMAYETVAELAQARIAEAENNLGTEADGDVPTSVESALGNYKKGLEDGLLRIMSKMGISTVDSYRGAQTFETLGLSDQVVENCFDGVVNRLPTVGYKALTRDVLARHHEAYHDAVVYKRGTALPRTGAYGHVRGGEYHSLNPLVFNKLRSASSKKGGYELYEKYSD